MVELLATVNHDLQSYKKKQVSQVIRHNKHDPNEKHSNTAINFAESKYNGHVKLRDMKDELKDLYEPESIRRNSKLASDLEKGKIANTQYLERLTSVNSLTKDRVVGTGILMQVGNLDFVKLLQDQLGIKTDMVKCTTNTGLEYERPVIKDPKDQKRWADFWKDMYVNTYQEVFGDCKGFKGIDVSVHMDEATPHMHIVAINDGGKTPTGKQRGSAKSTMIEFLDSKGINRCADGRKNLKSFRDYADHVLFDNAKKSLDKYYPGNDIDLKFTRTGGKTGLSQKAYQELANIKTKTKKAKKELKDTETKLEDVKTQKNDAESDFKDALSKLAQIQAKNAQMEADARENDKRIKEQQKELEELEAKVEQRKAKERELEQREAEVKRRELYANVTEADREDLKYAWFKSLAEVSGERIFDDGMAYGRALERNDPWRDNLTWRQIENKYITKEGIDNWFDGAMPRILKVRKRKRPNLEKSKAQDNGLEL